MQINVHIYNICDPQSEETNLLIGPADANLDALSQEFLENTYLRTRYALEFAEWLQDNKGWTPITYDDYCFVDKRNRK